MRTRILIFLAVVALLAACKRGSVGDYESVSRKVMGADSTAMADTARMLANEIVRPPEKLVKTAGINFKVKDARRTGEDIAELTKVFGGMVMHHHVQSVGRETRDVHISNDSVMRIAAFNTTGEMIVRVPSEKLEDFITKVSHLGIYVNDSRMDIEDKSLDYLATRLKLKDREELVSQQKAGKVKIKNPVDVLLLKDDMTDQKIENLRTDAAVKFSTISLSFYQSDTIFKEIIANDDPSAYSIPVFQRLGLAFANGWSIFVDVIVATINLWMFILAGIVVWRALIYYKRKSRITNTTAA